MRMLWTTIFSISMPRISLTIFTLVFQIVLMAIMIKNGKLFLVVGQVNNMLFGIKIKGSVSLRLQIMTGTLGFLYPEYNSSIYIILRTQFDDLKKDFIVEVQDNYIRIFSFDEKEELVISLYDKRIRKSMLNTLVASGGFGGSGSMRIRGIVRKGNIMIPKRCL